MTNLHLLSYRASNTLRLLERIDQPAQEKLKDHRAELESLANTIESISLAPANSLKQSVYQALETALEDILTRLNEAINSENQS